MPYIRPIAKLVNARLLEPRKTMQVLIGPRQVGKTTLIKQAIKECKMPFHYVSADLPTVNDIYWLNQQWEVARNFLRDKENSHTGALLILDEIQKIPNWSDMVKKLWDEDTFHDLALKVILLGSSPLPIEKGINESLAGRFEIIPITHWSYSEMQEAFDWSLEQYIYFGGYPGSAEYINNEMRWKDYITNSLIETTISRDVLLMSRIDKPALLRQLFQLSCSYSAQILSYQKMLGQLHDVGNATTLAHYLKLLAGAGLVTGVEKYSAAQLRKKASSPKLQVLNTALISAQQNLTFNEAQQNREYWGRLVESAVGAYLLNSSFEKIKVYYWREGNYEIDFVVENGQQLIGIEIKSGSKRASIPGFKKFESHYKLNKMLLVGANGINLLDFLANKISRWL